MPVRSRLSFVSFCAVLVAASAAYAAPHVVSIQPQSQLIDVPTNGIIQVTFDEPIDTFSVSPLTFRIFGRWSGPASGNRTVSGNTISFTPNQPFFAGEWVTVNLSRGIKNISGEPMTQGWEIKEELDNQIDAVIEGEAGTEPTTVVDFSDDGPEVVRVGSGDPAPFE